MPQEANETVDPETIVATKKDVRNLNQIRQAQQANSLKDQFPKRLKLQADLTTKGILLVVVSTVYIQVSMAPICVKAKSAMGCISYTTGNYTALPPSLPERAPVVSSPPLTMQWSVIGVFSDNST